MYLHVHVSLHMLCVFVCVYAGSAVCKCIVGHWLCSPLVHGQASSDVLSALWATLREAVCTSDSRLVCAILLYTTVICLHWLAHLYSNVKTVRSYLYCHLPRDGS